MPKNDLYISVRLENNGRSFGRSVVIRGETKVNNERFSYQHVMGSHEAEMFFEIDNFGSVFVRDREWFKYITRDIQDRLARLIVESFEPRVSVGG